MQPEKHDPRNSDPDNSGPEGTGPDNSHAHRIVASIVLVLVLFWLLFSYLNKTLNTTNRHIRGKSTAKYHEVLLYRNRQGIYRGRGTLNNMPTTYVVARIMPKVIVPSALAKKLQLSRGKAEKIRAGTRRITAYPTRINRIRLGPIEFRNIHGYIYDNPDRNHVLLGMNVLEKLEITQRGKTMILRQNR